jgi:hypothetical protein
VRQFTEGRVEPCYSAPWRKEIANWRKIVGVPIIKKTLSGPIIRLEYCRGKFFWKNGAFAMSDPLVCGVRQVAAPDGTMIPVPVGGLGLSDGAVDIGEDAEVQIHPRSDNGYYVVLNNDDPSNEEASDLFTEFTTEGAITTLEHLATQAFSSLPEVAIEAAGLLAGVLVSLFTSSHITREVFIRAQLEDDATPVTYCLLL